MSIRQISRVFDLPASISSASRMVLVALADNANDAGECWPGIETVAAKTAMSPRNVIRLLQALADPSPGACRQRGTWPLLSISPTRKADGTRDHNRYRLCLEAPADWVPCDKLSPGEQPQPCDTTGASHVTNPARTLYEPSVRTVNTPPTPLTEGGAEAIEQKPPATTGARPTTGSTEAPATAAEVVARVWAVYAEAFGPRSALPADMVRAVGRLCRGRYAETRDAELTRRVTAEDLRRARQWDGRSGLPHRRRPLAWSWSKVLAWMVLAEEQEAARQAVLARRRLADEVRLAEEAERRRRGEECQRRVAAFLALPEAERQAWRERTLAGCPYLPRDAPEFVDIAAALEWEKAAGRLVASGRE